MANTNNCRQENDKYSQKRQSRKIQERPSSSKSVIITDSGHPFDNEDYLLPYADSYTIIGNDCDRCSNNYLMATSSGIGSLESNSRTSKINSCILNNLNGNCSNNGVGDTLINVPSYHSTYYYYASENTINDEKYFDEEINNKLVAMRVFLALLLNTWRKKRVQINNLNKELNWLHNMNIKYRMQTNSFNSLLKIEQKQTEHFNTQLKISEINAESINNLYNDLNFSYFKLRRQRMSLKKDIKLKIKENNNLNLLLTQARCDVLKYKVEINELQDQLDYERKRNARLEYDIKYLKNKIEDDILNFDKKLKNEIKSRDEIISYHKIQIKNLEIELTELMELKNVESELIEMKIINMTQQRIIQHLSKKVNHLERLKDNTIEKRLVKQITKITKITFEVFKYIPLFDLLPTANSLI